MNQSGDDYPGKYSLKLFLAGLYKAAKTLPDGRKRTMSSGWRLRAAGQGLEY
jgi:hypothetical protein